MAANVASQIIYGRFSADKSSAVKLANGASSNPEFFWNRLF